MNSKKRSEQNQSNWRSRNNKERFSENTNRSLWLHRSSLTPSNSLQTWANDSSTSSRGIHIEHPTKMRLSIIHLNKLTAWSLKEPNELIQEIAHVKQKFQDYYLELESKDDKIVLVIKILAKLCLSSTSHQEEFLNNMASNKKFILNLEIFIMKLTFQSFEFRMWYTYYWINPREFFNNMYVVLNHITNATPRRACNILPKVLKTLITCLPLCEIEEELLNEVQGKIAELIEKLILHANELGENEEEKMLCLKKLFEDNVTQNKTLKDLERSHASSSNTVEGKEISHGSINHETEQMGKVGFMQVKEWSEKDVNEVVPEIIDKKNYFEKSLEHEIPGDKIVLVVKIFANLSVSSVLHQEVLKIALKEKFLKNIEIFIMRLPLQTAIIQKYYAYFWNNVPEFFLNLTILLDYVTNIVRTDDCHALLELFETLKIYLPMFESEHNIELPTEIKVTITALNERLLKFRNMQMNKKFTAGANNKGNFVDQMENNEELLSENTNRSLWLHRSSFTPSNFLQTWPNDSSVSSRDDRYKLTVGTLMAWSFKEENELVQIIIQRIKQFEECYLEMDSKNDRIVLVIIIFSKLCTSSTIDKEVFLNMVTNEKFILNLEIFIMKLTLQTFENRVWYRNFWSRPYEFFNNTYKVLNFVINATPTRACKVLPKVLKTLTTCLPLCEIEEELLKEVQGKIAELIEKLTLHANEVGEDEKEKMLCLKKPFEDNLTQNKTLKDLKRSRASSSNTVEVKEINDLSHGSINHETEEIGTVDFMQVKEWSEKDINKVVPEIIDKKNYFEKSLEHEIPGDKIVLVVKIFANLSVSSVLHQEVLKIALKEKFLKNIEIFIMRLPLQTAIIQKYYAYFWNNVPEFFINLTILLDYVVNIVSTDCHALLELFETLKIYLPMFESEHNIKLSTEIKVKITALKEKLLKALEHGKEDQHQC